MKRLALTLLAASLATAGIGNVAAEHRDQYDRSQVRSDVARVTRVEPLFTHYNQGPGQLRQECWNERTGRAESGYYRDESGRLYREGKDDGTKGAVIGAIIGGVLGNQVGDGRGRTAATVAGAAVGAAVGKNADENDRFARYDRYRDSSGVERRCRTVEVYTDRGRGRDREAYRVTYSYAGQTYQTQTNYHPGRTMRVLVNVRPQDDRVADYRDDYRD